MRRDVEPIVGGWYQCADEGIFTVVALDEEDERIDIQYFDGDIEEMELDEWFDLELEWIEPPEDCRGPLDDIDNDDLGYSEVDSRGLERRRIGEGWSVEAE